jgi:polyisoprenoid-binding protein YceI
VAAPGRTRRKLTGWIVGAIVVVLLIVVGGPFVYFHFIQSDPPPPLTITDATTTPTSGGAGAASSVKAPLAGTWKVGNGSVVRYRIKETVFGQSGTAVGTTNSVTGTMTIAGTKVTAASFTVDMTTFQSDSGQRDGQFQGRIMDTADFPTATFQLTSPIELAPVPADGVAKSYPATGKLTIHGTTNTVTFDLETKRTGNTIAVQGSHDITFSDYGIDNPSGGPASVGDSGTLEFLLQFTPAA